MRGCLVPVLDFRVRVAKGAEVLGGCGSPECSLGVCREWWEGSIGCVVGTWSVRSRRGDSVGTVVFGEGREVVVWPLGGGEHGLVEGE